MCDEPVLWCRAPFWSGKRQKYVRYESFDEGVRRYLLIADAVRTAAERMVWLDHKSCAAPRHGLDDEDDSKECKRLRRARPWTGTEKQLRLFLTTVTYYESSYRRDVHEGSTRGDCDYKEVGGRKVLIEGSCRSHCLGQVKLEGKERSRRGYTKHQIVGTSEVATKRCLQTIVDRLSASRNVCLANQKPNKGHHAACVMGVYGGVTGYRADPRIKKRAKTYLDLLRAKPKLDKRTRKVLGLDDEDA